MCIKGRYTGEWVKKIQLFTAEYFSVLKKNQFDSFIAVPVQQRPYKVGKVMAW